jgi:hypothetical protein
MKVSIYSQFLTSFDTPYEFPLYRTKLQGDYNCAGFKKEYWKFESKHKVTKITEEMIQTTILTFDDPDCDFFKDMMSKDMLHGQGEYEIITENIYDKATERLINKLFKS